MSGFAYERLSAQDASFLWAEGPNEPMHIGGLAIFESGPLALEGGGIDIARYRDAIESVLHWLPRYRQRLDWTPIERWPIWVDDRAFDLGYHIRHISLPRPGTLDQLKELVGRIFSRQLDRGHPLWEIWVIEGLLEGEQFAVLNKVHHCMMDGSAGADVTQILMSPSPRTEPSEPLPYMPRAIPTPSTLALESLGLGIQRPLGALRRVFRSALSDRAKSEELVDGSRRNQVLREMLEYALRPASRTPINGKLGPHRHLEWMTMPMDHVAEVRKALDCTINDVVLATVTEAMRRYLFRRRIDTRKLDFRVAAPVNVRGEGHDRQHGNHVSTWIVPLPLDTDDPLEQIRRTRETTRTLKETNAASVVDGLMNAAEFLPPIVLSKLPRLAQGPANMIVTNVPGPQFPLYSVGARLLGLYPLVPLMPGGGLGIALFGYEGKLCWGFNADRELVPNLAAVAEDVRSAFESLRKRAITDFISKRTATPEVEEAPPKKEAKLETLAPRKKEKARRSPANGADRTTPAAAAGQRAVQ